MNRSSFAKVNHGANPSHRHLNPVINEKKLLTLLLLCFAIADHLSAQTYSLDWSGSYSPAWVAGTTNRTTNNVGSSGINITTSFVNSAANSTWQNSTPAVGNVGSIAWTLPGSTGTGSMVLWVDWANTQQKITCTILFSAPIANPSFYVGDIDKSDASVTNTDNYLDRITVTGTTPASTTLNSTVTKFNSGSTIINTGSNAAWANNIAGQGGNAPTNAASGTAQDGTALFSITGTVSSITIVYDNFNNANTGVNPTGQAINIGDISFTKTIPVSGTVYNDVNGNQLLNGAEPGIEPVTLYVNTTDVATGKVVGVASINSDRTYSFPTLASNSNITLTLSTVAGLLGNAVPAEAAVSGYANTTPLTISTSTVTSGLSGQNFGLDRLPIPTDNSLNPQVNPGGNNSVSLPSTTFSATDPDGGTISSIRITTFPSNANSITINGIVYTVVNFPTGGISIPASVTGQPTWQIAVDPVDGIQNVLILYKATDNAGKKSSVTGTAQCYLPVYFQ
jgi:hypothetical protein